MNKEIREHVEKARDEKGIHFCNRWEESIGELLMYGPLDSATKKRLTKTRDILNDIKDEIEARQPKKT